MSKKNSFMWILEGVLQKGKKAKRAGWSDGNTKYIVLNQSKDGFLMLMTGGANIPWTPNNKDLFSKDWEEV